MARVHLLAATLLVLSPGSLATADDDGADDSMASRHVLELSLEGGAMMASDRPRQLDVEYGGFVAARAAFDLIHARADARLLLRDPSRPELLGVRADARLLFVVAHDFTYRATDAGELLRVFGGLGGEIDLPDDSGHLMLSAGFAMHRVAPSNGNAVIEEYGGYAGVTLRLHIWEIRNELRVAVHAMANPADFVLSLDVESMLGQLAVGFTGSDRLYVQAVREDAFSLGPELVVSYEGLVAGPVFNVTLGLAGTLGL